jgi:flavin reductase (DIM6/NTAB) family NADH-FMN oxidoreductase RutF
VTVDADTYRRVVGAFATGVTVVTAYSGGRHHAMTANSFTSVSLDPVLALVAIEKRARFHDAVLAAETFAVNVLAAGQEELSRWFATRGRPQDDEHLDRFGYAVGEASGAALFDGALATLECARWAAYDGGDHTLLLGSVLAFEGPSEGEPLVYFRGTYRALEP